MRSYVVLIGASIAAVAMLAATGLAPVALGVVALLPLPLLAMRSAGDGTLQARLPVLGFLLGQIACWDVAFLAAVYTVPEAAGLGIGAETSLRLCCLLTWSAAAGSLLALQQRLDPPAPIPGPVVRRGVIVGMALFFVYAAASVADGSLTARVRGNDIDALSVSYLLGGTITLLYPGFFFLGVGALGRRPAGTLIRLALLLACMLAVGLTGGREYAIRMALVFLAGALYSSGPRRTMAFALALAPVVLAFVVVVGMARGRDNFGTAPVSERAEIMRDAARSDDDRARPLLLRIAEPTGQLVIVETERSGMRAGFENFERLLTLFVPAIFLGGDKAPLDDGPEILARDYGVAITSVSSAPITLMADAYRRGGELAVVAAGFAIGAWLTVLGRTFSRFKWPGMAGAMTAILSIAAVRLYAFSALGFFHSGVYTPIRDVIVLWLPLMVIARGVHAWSPAIERRRCTLRNA